RGACAAGGRGLLLLQRGGLAVGLRGGLSRAAAMGGGPVAASPWRASRRPDPPRTIATEARFTISLVHWLARPSRPRGTLTPPGPLCLSCGVEAQRGGDRSGRRRRHRPGPAPAAAPDPAPPCWPSAT